MRLKYIFAFVILLFLSCSKDKDAMLDGRWQATTIESPRHNLRADSLFWSFDKGVCEFQTLHSSNPHYAEQIYANYLIFEDSIKISIPARYMYLAKENRYLDWKTPERKFAIRDISSKSLILSVNDTIYSFRKYY